MVTKHADADEGTIVTLKAPRGIRPFVRDLVRPEVVGIEFWETKSLRRVTRKLKEKNKYIYIYTHQFYDFLFCFLLLAAVVVVVILAFVVVAALVGFC